MYIFPKKWYSQWPKLQNVAACVLWSCQQRCKIYISLLKSGTHKHQNPKIPKNSSLCSVILSAKVQYIYFLFAKSGTIKDKTPKNSYSFALSVVAFQLCIYIVRLAMALSFKSCSVFLLTFFQKWLSTTKEKTFSLPFLKKCQQENRTAFNSKRHC